MTETTKQSERERPERCPRLVITPTQWKQGWIEYRPGNAITAVNREYANPVKRPDGNYEVDDPDGHSPVSEVKQPAPNNPDYPRLVLGGADTGAAHPPKRQSAPYLGPCGICGSDDICIHDELAREAAQPPAAAGSTPKGESDGDNRTTIVGHNSATVFDLEKDAKVRAPES